jgi:hypothetical protein
MTAPMVGHFPQSYVEILCEAHWADHLDELTKKTTANTHHPVEPGYLETDAPGAIFPMIRAADSVLEYSHVLERRAQKRIVSVGKARQVLSQPPSVTESQN